MQRVIVLYYLLFLIFVSCKSDIDTGEDSRNPVLQSEVIVDFLSDTTEYNETVDSLKLILQLAKADTSSIIIINDIANELLPIDHEQSIKLSGKAYKFSKELAFYYGITKAINNKALYYAHIEDFDSALNYLEKINEIKHKIPDRLLAVTFLNFGNIYAGKGRYNDALKSLENSLDITEGIIKTTDSLEAKEDYLKSIKLLGNIYKSFATLHIEKGESDTAIKYYNKSANAYSSIGQKNKSAIVYKNIATKYDDANKQDSAIIYYELAYEYAEQGGNLHLASAALNNMGIVYERIGDFYNAIKNYEESLEIRHIIKEKDGIASTLNNLGNVYKKQGDYIQSLEYHLESLRIKEEINDSIGIANSLNNIGLIYVDQKDFDIALDYYRRSLEIRKKLKDKSGIAGSYNNIGIVYRNLNNLDEAINYYKKSLAIREELGQQRGIAIMLNNIAIIYRQEGNYEQALNYFQRSYNTQKAIGFTSHIASTLNNIGLLYTRKGEYNKAYIYAKEAYEAANNVGNPLHVRNAARLLKDIYISKEDHKKALEHYETFVLMHDSITNVRNKNLLEKRHWQHEYEKKAIADSIKHASDIQVKTLELAKRDEEAKRHRVAIYSLFAIFILLASAVILFLRGYRIKEKANKAISEKNEMLQQANKEIRAQHKDLSELNAELSSINEEILAQKDELLRQKKEAEKQRKLIEEKNKEILEKNEEILQQKEELQIQSSELAKMNATLEDRIKEELSKSRKKDFLLIQQSRQAAMGEMIANIAHQWRQPLNAVGLIIQNIQEAYEYNDISEEYLDKKVSQSMDIIQYMSQTITDFRDFFKPEKTPSEFNVKEAVLKSISFVEDTLKSANIKLEYSLDDQIYVYGFANEYSQVILNLINNAKDALLEKKPDNPEIKISLANLNGKSQLTITDNGGGISPGIMDQIFNPYYTTKPEGEGTGLGLYMSKTIIEKHEGGSLTFENTDDGAKFIVTL